MRLVELAVSDPTRRVPLHPRLTVVGGIDPLAQVAADVAAAFAGNHATAVRVVADTGASGLRDLADCIGGGDPKLMSILRASDLPEPEVPPVVAPTEAAVPAPEARQPQSDARLAEIDARRAVVTWMMARPVPDARGVIEALEVLEAASNVAERTRERRLSLADAWTDVMIRLSACLPTLAPSDEVLEDARAAVATARSELWLAERALGTAPPEDLAELERAHELVEAAEARAARPLSGAAARRELAEARQAERAILDGLGFASYMERHLTEALFRPDASAFEHRDRAQAALDEATAVLSELEVIAEEAGRRERLEAEAAGYAAAAERYLGGRPAAPDLAVALRTAADPGVDAARSQLAESLARAGTTDTGELVPIAHHFIADSHARAAEHDELRRELEGLDAERASLVEPVGVADEVVPVAPRPATPEVAEARHLEMFLLSLLAGRRATDALGPVPLVAVDTFAGLADDACFAGLRLLERMADAVQVVYLTEDRRIHSWAAALGAERAASRCEGWTPVQVASAPEPVIDLERPPDRPPPVDAPVTPGLTIAEGVEIARRQQDRVGPPIAPVRDAAKPTYCQACRFEVATGVCEGCAKHLCDDHLIRTAGRGRRAGRTLCVQCGLVAAGVRRVGR